MALGTLGGTLYRVGEPALGIPKLSLAQPLEVEVETEVFGYAPATGQFIQTVTWEADPDTDAVHLHFDIPTTYPIPRRWYHRLHYALTRPRTLWPWLTPWR